MWVNRLQKQWPIFLYDVGDRVMLEDGDTLPLVFNCFVILSAGGNQ